MNRRRRLHGWLGLATAALLFCPLGVVAAGPQAGPPGNIAKFLWLLVAELLLAALAASAGFAVLLSVKVLFARRSQGSLAALGQYPWRCVALGVVNIAVLLFVAAACRKAPLIAGLLALLLIVICCFGLAAVSERFGSRIIAADGRKEWPVSNLAVGWFALVFAAMVPLVGWAIFAVALASGVGAVVLSFFIKPSESPANT